jgi:hypothetical protein
MACGLLLCHTPFPAFHVMIIHACHMYVHGSESGQAHVDLLVTRSSPVVTFIKERVQTVSLFSFSFHSSSSVPG